MRRITIKEKDGKEKEAFIPENAEELESQIKNTTKQNLKEHLYIAFLTLGVLSFSIGIFFSLKKLNTIN